MRRRRRRLSRRRGRSARRRTRSRRVGPLRIGWRV